MDKHAGKYRNYDIYKYLYNCYFQPDFYHHGHADKHCTDINLYTDPDIYAHSDAYSYIYSYVHGDSDQHIDGHADTNIAKYGNNHGHQYGAGADRYPNPGGSQSMAMPRRSGYAGYVCRF